MLRLCCAFLACLVLLAPLRPACAAVDALRLTLQVETRLEEDGKKPVTEKQAVLALLQEDGLILRRDGVDTVYDFTGRRMLSVDHSKKVILNESLYAVPAFRVKELRHRMGMQALVVKTKGADHDYRFIYPGHLEHTYGLTTGADTGVTLTKRQSGASLSYDGEPLAQYEHGNWQIPEKLADSYRRLLIYGYAMHPRLRADMQQALRGFGRLSLHHRTMDKQQRHREITVEEVMPVQPQSLSGPDGYDVYYINAKKLQPAIAAVHAEKDKRSADDYLAQIEQSLARERYTEAMLAAWEHMVQFGTFPEGQVDRIVTAAPEKDWSRSLVSLIANPPGEGDDIAAYTKSFQTVADHVTASNKYELNVHLADLYLRQGDAQRAFDMLAHALGQNPYLTAAWVSLGDIFYRQYDMEAAFACWDAALAIAPEHSLVVKKREYRDSLAAEYPEFF